MKPFILMYIITFLALSYADDEIVEISDKCMNEIMENIIAAERCMDEKIGTPVDIFNRFKSIVFSYNNSDNSFVNLIEFAHKNCAHAPEISQCLQMKLKYTSECPSPNTQRDDVSKVIYSGIESLANYICADNFDVIRKLIFNDGLRFLLINDDFDKCFENVADRYIDRTEQICPLIDIAAPCILNVIGDHPNSNVPIVAQEIIRRFKTVANC